MSFGDKGTWATEKEEGTGNILQKRELRDQFYPLHVSSKIMLQKPLFNSCIFIAYSLNIWNLVKLSKLKLPTTLCFRNNSIELCPLKVKDYTQIPMNMKQTNKKTYS